MKIDMLIKQWLSALAAAVIGLAALTAAAADKLPAAWSGMDIGGALPAGQASESNGAFTLTGRGGGIAPDADTFHFVFRALSTDGSLVAHLSSVSSPSAGALGGIMIRDSLSTTSNFAAVVLTQGKAGAFWHRTDCAPSATFDAAPLSSPSAWLRLTRVGTKVNGFAAPDAGGKPGAWKRLGMPQTLGSGMIFVGLCASSPRPSACTASFDQVSFTEGALPVVDEGTYRIVPVSAPAMALEARPRSAKGADVHLAPFADAPAVEWSVTFKGDGYYQIQSLAVPPLCLSAPADRVGNGVKTTLSAKQDPATRLWKMVPIGEDAIGMLPKSAESFALDDFGGNGTPDAIIDVYNFVPQDSHMQWRLVPLGAQYPPAAAAASSLAPLDDGTYVLAPAKGPEMAMAAASGTGSRPIALAGQPGDSSQKWVFTNKGDNWYRIQLASDPTLSLTVSPGPSKNGVRLIAAPDQGLSTQLWQVRAAGNGMIRLAPKSAPNMSIDDPGGQTTAGSTIGIWESDNGNLNLQWVILGAK